jgi:hypothetical protein
MLNPCLSFQGSLTHPGLSISLSHEGSGDEIVDLKVQEVPPKARWWTEEVFNWIVIEGNAIGQEG